MFTLNCRGKLLVARRPLVMGIINVTPDSFYGESRFTQDAMILQQAETMLAEGAEILDIGGQSTRPGAGLVGEEEELRRVVGPIEALHRRFPAAVISVDTWYARVALRAVEAGAGIVNDVSGGSLDAGMLETVGRLQAPYVCMHMKGTPATMNKEAHYDHLTLDLLDYFIQRVADCRAAGIRDVIVDPGMGFAKNGQQNLRLLRHLALFRMLECPILLGISRKSVIYRTLGVTAAEALNGTTVLNAAGLLNGAGILRVHDVKAAREAVILMEAYENA